MKRFRLSPVVVLMVLAAASPAVSGGRPFSPEPYYAPEKWWEFDGAQLCYLEAGEGEALVLIHGWAGNAWNWMSVFEPLSRNHRVIVPDLPGHGKSGCPAEDDYSLAGFAEVIIRLLDHLGLEQANLVGSSMGGAVAGWCAVRYPGRVRRLILVDAAGTSVQNPLMRIAGRIMTPASVIPLIHLFFPVTERTQARMPLSEQKRVELAEMLYQSSRRKCAARSLSFSMRSLAKDVLDPYLPQINIPTLVIWGSDDELLPQAAGERYCDLIPGARLVIIEGGSHTPMQWRPEEFVRIVEGFLREQD